MIELATWCGAVGRREWRIAAWALAAAIGLAGCTSFGSFGDSAPAPAASSGAPPAPSSDTSFTSRVKSFFSGASPQLANNPNQPPTPDFACPGVEQRQGAATLAVNAPGAENSALSLRYQASFTRTARECIVRGGDLLIKVGVQGRVILGPAGAPGPVDVPVRYALVREGLTPKPVWTKLYVFPVPMTDGQSYVPFVHVEEDMLVPMPREAELDAYVIYVGFDPEGVAPPKPAPKPRTARSK
jgi:hypothetical protein